MTERWAAIEAQLNGEIPEASVTKVTIVIDRDCADIHVASYPIMGKSG